MTNNNRLIYLPLGGAGEIGMNMYLYGYGAEGKERFVLVDVGVTFPSMDGTPGVDLIFADPSYIVARGDRLDAIFITHAHEDHIGALARLYPKLGDIPVYARRFTARIARHKMSEHVQNEDAVVTAPVWPDMLEAGPFSVGFFPIPHSIPEASGLVIKAGGKTIFHTGDFKLDENPGVGEPLDRKALTDLGGQGVDVLVCDSTNVFSPNPGRSEIEIKAPITELVAGATGLVVATTFASNIARLKTLADAGVAAGRSIVVLGRAMQRMLRTAQETGVLDEFPSVVDVEDAHHIPRDQLMLIVTGSQGERRAASAQLANGKFLGFTMKPQDTFLFSSKTIPGNEIGVARIVNALCEQGVDVIDENAGFYHVSGHANRPDLIEMHQMIRPKMMVPMHGEYRHLKAHKELAEENGIASIIAPNGALVDLSDDVPEVIEHIETSRIYVDGSRMIGAFDGIVLERIRMATRGAVVVSIMLDGDDFIAEPWAEVLGLAQPEPADGDLAHAIENEVDARLSQTTTKERRNDDVIEEIAKRAVSRTCNQLVGKKPVTVVMINRMES